MKRQTQDCPLPWAWGSACYASPPSSHIIIILSGMAACKKGESWQWTCMTQKLTPYPRKLAMSPWFMAFKKVGWMPHGSIFFCLFHIFFGYFSQHLCILSHCTLVCVRGKKTSLQVTFIEPWCKGPISCYLSKCPAQVSSLLLATLSAKETQSSDINSVMSRRETKTAFESSWLVVFI